MSNKKEALMCQCPERGDLHFYTDKSFKKCVAKACQCPERGDLHFYYQEPIGVVMSKVLCVNALKGATSISTRRKQDEHSYIDGVSMP